MTYLKKLGSDYVEKKLNVGVIILTANQMCIGYVRCWQRRDGSNGSRPGAPRAVVGLSTAKLENFKFLRAGTW